MIQLQNVSFYYGDKPVLQNLSLALPDGSKTALMGRSGAGKTTLLSLMAGLLAPTGGSVTGIPDCGVAMVFQQDRLLPWYTVLQNLQIAVPHVPAKEAAALLEALGLAGCSNKLPAELSGGMARRVALARALLSNSPLLLLDEPFSALDVDTKQTVARVIAPRLTRRTLVAVVHDEGDAALLGAQILRPFG